ncbi:copper resistance protein B [Oleiagrimonas sp. C23AA]|nr:copper resistance protein B [Oleiagrimonas sp. C23AA]
MVTASVPALARQASSPEVPASKTTNTSMQSGKHRCVPMQGKPDDAHHAMKHKTAPSTEGCRMAMQAKGKAKTSMQGMRMDHMQMHQANQDAQRNPPIGSLPRSDGSAPKPYAAYGVTLRMPNDPLLSKVQLDSLEYVHGREGSAQAWDLRAWAGHNLDRVWLRTEGTRSQGRIEEGDAELLWGHAISPWWDLMLGARHDLGPGPARNWLAAGIQGIAPYQFDYETTFYLGPGGRSALRVRASQEWLFTQRLILEPEFEANAYGHTDPARGHGAGITDTSLTFRLRYEFSRKFAPYVGYAWVRQWGATAGMARREGNPVLDRQILLGLRVWF